MKVTSWILFGLAVVLTLGVLAMITRQAKMTPKEHFVLVEERARKGFSDREQTIANLDQVLDRAIDVGDVELATQVQLSRGRALMELGAFDRARDDLSAVAAARPGDVAVENDLAELEARSGDYRAAQDRVSRMIQRDPSNLSAYVRLGRLHQQAAERTVARTLEVLNRSLVPENSERARELLENSTALLPGDPRRVALSDELRELMSGGDDTLLQDAINAADFACQDMDAARDAFTRSLERGSDPEAIAGLISLYQRARHTSLGVDLGTTTVRMGAVRSNPEFGRALLSGLVELGRERYAADLALTWVRGQTPISGEFCAECCAVLYRAKRWQELQVGAAMLWQIGSVHQTQWANLYMGFSLIELGAMRDGRQYLQSFCATDAPDPFPNARAIAFQKIARACKELGEPIPERTALQGLVELEPGLDPDAWLRLAELQFASPHGGYREPEMRWARGMSLLPKRTAELLPRWNEIGVLELRAVGLDLAAIRADLAHNKIWAPSADASPYELYRLAELYADASDYVRASIHVRKLLERVPGFVPGLDLAIRIADQGKKPKDRMSYLLERVGLAGRTSAIDKILREVQLTELSPKDLLALMRADPDRSGRLALADGLAREGRADEALALIQQLGADTLGDEGQLLIGRLHLARHEPVLALAALAPLVPGIYSAPGGLELLVRAGLGAGDRERMNQLGADLAGFVQPERTSDLVGTNPEFELSRERALWVVDQFLAFGAGEAAQPILEALDRSPRLRGGDVNLRLAGAAIARGDVDAARDALERAQAFDTRGSADYLALLLAAFEERTDDLRYLAGVAATSGYPAGPLMTAQLLIVGERGEDASVPLNAGLAREFADDPWWNLTAYAALSLRTREAPFTFSPFLGKSAATAAANLFGGVDGKQDPRLALVWVSAIRQRLAAPFLRAWLDRQAKSVAGSNLWMEYMRASLDAQWDATGSALTTLRRMRSRVADFGPVWNLEEALLSSSVRSQEELASARARRVAALGDLAGTREQRLLDDAEEKAAAGLFEQALAVANEAVALDPTSVAASLAVASIQRQMGRSVPALTTLRALVAARAKAGRSAASRVTGRGGNDLVREYLEAIDSARRLEGGVVTWSRAATLVEELADHLKDDSRVVLAAAELDLEQDKRNPTLGVARAYSRLDRFRSEHRGVSVEALGRGSLQSWARFYAKLDPSRARAFVEEELALAPTILAGWIELARALEAEGDSAGALEQLRLTARLSPQGSVERDILRLRAQGELPHDDIEAVVNGIVTAEGLSAPDAELSLLHARCLLNQGPRVLERVGQLLARVDPASLSPRLANEHALLMSTALVMRGRPADKQAARPILEALKQRELDPYVLGFVDALEGLAKAP